MLLLDVPSFDCWPGLFERCIMLSTGQTTIQRIALKEFYPVDSVIQPLNSWDPVSTFTASCNVFVTICQNLVAGFGDFRPVQKDVKG